VAWHSKTLPIDAEKLVTGDNKLKSQHSQVSSSSKRGDQSELL